MAASEPKSAPMVALSVLLTARTVVSTAATLQERTHKNKAKMCVADSACLQSAGKCATSILAHKYQASVRGTPCSVFCLDTGLQ
jgi:hypothetical protein